jgi:WhiB family redox-sensing transcriptional regulator
MKYARTPTPTVGDSYPRINDFLDSLRREPWMARAVCTQTDPDAFFPGEGASAEVPIAICRRCPVRRRCADYAIQHKERFGVWGGTLTPERRKKWLAA